MHFLTNFLRNILESKRLIILQSVSDITIKTKILFIRGADSKLPNENVVFALLDINRNQQSVSTVFLPNTQTILVQMTVTISD